MEVVAFMKRHPYLVAFCIVAGLIYVDFGIPSIHKGESPTLVLITTVIAAILFSLPIWVTQTLYFRLKEKIGAQTNINSKSGPGPIGRVAARHAEKLLDKAAEQARELDTTTSPQVFFEGYEALMKRMFYLVFVSPFVNMSGIPVREIWKEIKSEEKREACIHDLVSRSENELKKQLTACSTVNKCLGAIDEFMASYTKYKDKIPQKEWERIRKIYKEEQKRNFEATTVPQAVQPLCLQENAQENQSRQGEKTVLLKEETPQPKRTRTIPGKAISETDSLEVRRREAASIKTARQEEYARKREAEAAAQKAEQERLLKEYEKRKNQIANYTDEELMQEAARAAGEFVHVDQKVMRFLLPGISEEKITSIVKQLVNLHILTETSQQGRYLCRMDRSEIERILRANGQETDNASDSVSRDKLAAVDAMDGHEFEYFCAELLKENGFVNVEVTQASGDFGVDVLAEKDGVTYAVQCKCYSDKVGNHAVQEATSGAQYYHRMVAVVLTNSTFTPAAIETAQKTNVLLWDRENLKEMMA